MVCWRLRFDLGPLVTGRPMETQILQQHWTLVQLWSGLTQCLSLSAVPNHRGFVGLRYYLTVLLAKSHYVEKFQHTCKIVSQGRAPRAVAVSE